MTRSRLPFVPVALALLETLRVQEPDRQARRHVINKAGAVRQVRDATVQIKMLTHEQMRVLFGRTLAYTIKTKCGNTTKTIKVRASINQSGKLRRLSG